MKRRPNAIATFVRTYPFGILLLAIFVMIVGAPLTAEFAHRVPGAEGPGGLAPLTILLTLAAAYAIWNHGSHRRAVTICVVGGILALLGLASLLTDRQRVPDFVHLFAQTLFLLYVTGSILRAVFRARVVDGNVLCGAACVYLLAGALCGYAYAMLEIVNHKSFTLTDPAMAASVDLYDQPGWLIYFSYTTLTTVGFGDVLPASSLARSLSVLEAVIGQIMLVVMIARLVGLHVAHSTTGHPGKLEISSDEKS
ncbi:MAG: potassium channel family protein [Chthoniobacterales bacterium]